MVVAKYIPVYSNIRVSRKLEEYIQKSYHRRLKVACLMGALFFLLALFAKSISVHCFLIKISAIVVFIWAYYSFQNEESYSRAVFIFLFLALAGVTSIGSVIYLSGGINSPWAMGPGIIAVLFGFAAYSPPAMAAAISIIGMAGFAIPVAFAGGALASPLLGGYLANYLFLGILNVVVASAIYNWNNKIVKAYSSVKDLSKKSLAREKESAAHRKRVDDLSRSQSEFLRNIRLQLSSPLTKIRESVESISSSFQNIPPIEAKMLREISGNSKKILRIIDNLSDLASISQSRMSLKCAQISAPQLVYHVVAFAKDDLKAAGHELKVECECPCLIMCDVEKMTQALTNILDNAMKFTPPDKGRITIGCKGSDEGVDIFVRDNGPGIMTELIDTIFEPFWSDREVKTDSSAGIGLAITKKIVEMHGGKIIVKSNSGRGSEFRVTMPVCKMDPAPAALAS